MINYCTTKNIIDIIISYGHVVQFPHWFFLDPFSTKIAHLCNFSTERVKKKPLLSSELFNGKERITTYFPLLSCQLFNSTVYPPRIFQYVGGT